MLSKEAYLNPETLEDVERFIESSLKLGSSVRRIAEGLAGHEKGVLLLTKELGLPVAGMNRGEIVGEFVAYINEEFAGHIKGSGISNEMQELLEKRYGGMDMDEYCDFITDVVNQDPYQKVHHDVTQIILCFDDYMTKHHPEEYQAMTLKEREVALIGAIKEHLTPRGKTGMDAPPE